MDSDTAPTGLLPSVSDFVAQQAPNPDAQTTVSDFLDYTEYLPSDLARSLRLIGQLDGAYNDAVANVHTLTKIFGQLPQLPASDRPDPVQLRKDISAALDKARYCREASAAEASRLYEVAERHAVRLDIITEKLKVLPEPPSRDPTPPPVSPQQSRLPPRPFDRTPRVTLHLDGARPAASTARPRDRNRKSRVVEDSSDSGSDSDPDLRDVLHPGSARKRRKDKTPRPPRPPRPRQHNVTTISTSSALAALSPPPPDARPGSKWAPWFQLTEYEMAVLRKMMKKNAMWTPSDTMIRRELEKKGRGHEFYNKEKARCEATGEEMLDEAPYTHSSSLLQAVASDANASVAEAAGTPGPSRNTLKDDTATVNKGMKLNEAKEAKKLKRESQREQAMRDAEKLEQATRKIKEAAESLQQLNFPADAVTESATPARGPSTLKPNKRKRESSLGTAETPTVATRETSHVFQEDDATAPEPKRPRLLITQDDAATADAPSISPQTDAAAPEVHSEPRAATPAAPSPMVSSPVPLPAGSPKVTTTQVPLASPGPSTPRASEAPTSRAPSRAATLEAEASTLPSPQPTKGVTPPVLVPPNATAASTRSRRASVAPSKAATPPAAPAEPETAEVEDREQNQQAEQAQSTQVEQAHRKQEEQAQSAQAEQAEQVPEQQVQEAPQPEFETTASLGSHLEPEKDLDVRQEKGAEPGPQLDGHNENQSGEPVPEPEAPVEPASEPVPEPKQLRSSPAAPTLRLRSTRAGAATEPEPQDEDVEMKDEAEAAPIPDVEYPPEPGVETKPRIRTRTQPIRASPPAPTTLQLRTRTRGNVPTPKAQSEEPALNDPAGKSARERRRHSIFTQSTVAPPPRTSTRKKPPPKGEVSSHENGQKTLTHKRANGRKNKKTATKDKKEKPDENVPEPDDIDPDEPRYCICDDVAYGDMIQCDNNCEKEWFHFECVGMSTEHMPARRAKWYCPDCRAAKGTDAYGKPLIPPSLPGRRGNR